MVATTFTQPAAEVLPSDAPNTGLLVLPGLPDFGVQDGERALYPPTVTDLVKLARQANIEIGFVDQRDRAYVGLRAAETWLPILVFVEDALAAGVGVIIGDILRELVGVAGERRAKLHIKLGRLRTKDATIDWMMANGNAEDVFDAIDRFFAGSEQDP